MSKHESSSAGIGLSGALFLIFLVLKLTDVIDWSWWWITAPLWGQVILSGIIITGVYIYAWFLERKHKKELRRNIDYRNFNDTIVEPKKSRFMEKLDAAMKASEERRKQNQN
jgi:hypothetical protein